MKRINKNFLIVVSILVIGCVLLAVLIFFQNSGTKSDSSSDTTATQSVDPNLKNPYAFEATLPAFNDPLSLDPSKVIGKVGEENIYFRDIIQESNYSSIALIQSNYDRILGNVVQDSAILQAGRDENLLTLSNVFFNNLNKDYTKRKDSVNVVTRTIKTQGFQIEGRILKLYYGGSDDPNLEANKSLVVSKLNKAKSDIQAGGDISLVAYNMSNDPQVLAIDLFNKQYPSISFRGDSVSPIFTDINPADDQAIKSLSAGQSSSVYTAAVKAADGKTVKNQAYFVIVTSKTVNKQFAVSYDEWLKTIKNKYVFQKIN